MINLLIFIREKSSNEKTNVKVVCWGNVCILVNFSRPLCMSSKYIYIYICYFDYEIVVRRTISIQSIIFYKEI